VLNRIWPVYSPVSLRLLIVFQDVEGLNYAHSYLISDNIVYLVITDKSYPRKLAFSYLDELSKEFWTSYGPRVEGVRKPYAFVGFGGFTPSLSFGCLTHPRFAYPDTFMSKTARLYQDTRNVAGGSNLDKLNDELHDVTKIMTKNMEELLWRGDSLDREFTSTSHVPPPDPFIAGMSHLSTSLRSESEKYRKAARNINFQAMLRQYAPVVAVVFVIFVIIFWKLSG